MPKWFLGDDPFATAADDSRRCRRPSLALCVLLIPALGFTGLIYSAQAKFSKGICRAFQADPAAERLGRAEHRAVQLREVETARANVLYWTRRSHEDGPTKAADLAKLAAWQRGYKQRQALFARLYPPH